MANIKTITEIFWSGSNDSNFQAASGSYEEEKSYLEDHEANCEVKTTYQIVQRNQLKTKSNFSYRLTEIVFTSVFSTYVIDYVL